MRHINFPDFPHSSKATYLRIAIEARHLAWENIAHAKSYRAHKDSLAYRLAVDAAKVERRAYWKWLKKYYDLEFSNLHIKWEVEDAA